MLPASINSYTLPKSLRRNGILIRKQNDGCKEDNVSNVHFTELAFPPPTFGNTRYQTQGCLNEITNT